MITQPGWRHGPSSQAAAPGGCNSADRHPAGELEAPLARQLQTHLLLALLPSAHLLLAAGRQWGCATAAGFAARGSRPLPATRQAAGLGAGCWTGPASAAAGRHAGGFDNRQLHPAWLSGMALVGKATSPPLFPAARQSASQPSQPAGQPGSQPCSVQQPTLRAGKTLAQEAGSVPPSSLCSRVREVRRQPTCLPPLGCPRCCAAGLAAAAAGGEPEPEEAARRRVRAARRPSPHAAGSVPVSPFSDRSSTVSRLHQQWHQKAGQV